MIIPDSGCRDDDGDGAGAGAGDGVVCFYEMDRDNEIYFLFLHQFLILLINSSFLLMDLIHILLEGGRRKRFHGDRERCLLLNPLFSW